MGLPYPCAGMSAVPLCRCVCRTSVQVCLPYPCAGVLWTTPCSPGHMTSYGIQCVMVLDQLVVWSPDPSAVGNVYCCFSQIGTLPSGHEKGCVQD